MLTEEILKELDILFPDARCELNHKNNYEMTVAVILSAQTTDASVNKVTESLFKKYPTIESLAEADLATIEKEINSLGLYRNKAKAIQGMAKVVVDKYHGIIPDNMKDLVTLPGVGRKCANVILSECYNIPSLAVDTHVNRVSKRLGLAKKDDDLLTVEKKLKEKYQETDGLNLIISLSSSVDIYVTLDTLNVKNVHLLQSVKNSKNKIAHFS